MVVLGIIAGIATVIYLGTVGKLDETVSFFTANGKTILRVAQIIALFIAGYFRKLKLAVVLIFTLCATEVFAE